MNFSDLQERLKPWIKKEKPLLVLLFGSTVTGNPGPKTDIDIAVLFGREVSPYQQIGALIELIGRDDVDLMYLDHADPIARQAACEGKLIYENEPGRFARFASLASRQFMDNEKFDRARRELTDEFLKARGFE